LIFQHTWEWIVKQSPWTQSPKTLTTRLYNSMKYDLVRDEADTNTLWEVRSKQGKIIWEPFKSYAVQPGRGKPGLAHIRITNLYFAPYAVAMNAEELHREGFDTHERYKEVWIAMHGKHREYAEGIRIQFELVKHRYHAEYAVDENGYKLVGKHLFNAFNLQHATAIAKEYAAKHGHDLLSVTEVKDIAHE
jgi:hypothetical protein